MQQFLVVVVTVLGIIVFAFAGYLLYDRYGEMVYDYFFSDGVIKVRVGGVAVDARIADDPTEWRRGLAGKSELGDLEGMLFIFPEEDYYSMWMRDMLLPLDLIFIDDNLRVVDIIEDVQPESYPKQFTSKTPARFVLEVNAFFVESFEIQEGQAVDLPTRFIPSDIRARFVEE